jgi:hypothetical protein
MPLPKAPCSSSARKPASATRAEGVALLVSRGQRDLSYVMPDLIGRDARSVLEILERAGLKVTDVRYRSYPGVAPGSCCGRARRPPARQLAGGAQPRREQAAS